MIKLKSEEGKCHLQMVGSSIDLVADVITALNAVMKGLHDAGGLMEEAAIKETIKAWAEGRFDD